MSVGSATESFSEGAELFDQEKYKSTVSTYTEPNPRAMEEEFKKPLSDRIHRIPLRKEGIYAEYILDDVKVRCPSDAFRAHQVHLWNNLKKEAEEKSWAWSVSAIISAGVTIVGGIGMYSPSSFASFGTYIATHAEGAAPYIAVIGLVATLVTGFGILSSHLSYNDARTQIDKWNSDPVLKVGKERDKAHERGFPYIFERQLKLGKNPSYTALFHPKQVEHEYKKYFDRFSDNLLGKSDISSKAAWMDNFSHMNPLSKSLMLYGLDRVPEHMAQVVEDYAKLESFLKNIRSAYEDLKARERSLAKERIEASDKERNALLQPSLDALNTQLAAAKKIRDQIIERHPSDTDTAHKDAKANYDAAKKALEEDYATRTAPITKRYDAKVKELEKDRDERIKKLDEQKSHQLVNNYHAARELLYRAHQAWNGQTYQTVNFSQYFPWQSGQSGQPQQGWYQQPPAPAQSYYQHPHNPAGYYAQPQYPATYTQQTVYYAQPQTSG